MCVYLLCLKFIKYHFSQTTNNKLISKMNKLIKLINLNESIYIKTKWKLEYRNPFILQFLVNNPQTQHYLMKQKDIMQSSLLQQNIFFQNLQDDDITNYQLKKAKKNNSPSMGADNTVLKSKKEKNNQQITSFMNKIDKQSLTVKLQIGKVQLDNSEDNQDKENLSNLQHQKIPSVKLEKPQNQSKTLNSNQSFVEIIGFQSQGSQNKENQQKEKSKIQANYNLQAANSKVQTEKIQKKSTKKFCLSFDDSDSDEEQRRTKKQNLQEKQNMKPVQKGRFKKVNYLSKKSLDESQNIINQEDNLTDKFQQKFQELNPASKQEPIKIVESQRISKQQKDIKQPEVEQKDSNQQETNKKILGETKQKQKKKQKAQKAKKPVLLMNFDSQDDGQQSQKSSSSQQFEDMIDIPKAIRKSQKSLQTNSQTKQTVNSNQNKILLNDFDDDEDSSDQNETEHSRNPILLKNATIDSSQSISSTEEPINLTRPINILEFSRMNQSLAYVYEPVPPNCIFQTIIKRYQTPHENSVIYEMFDYSTYKSILKVRNCSEGFQIFSSKESMGPNWGGNSKQIPQSDEETSCALLISNFLGTQFNCFKFNRNNQKPDGAKLNRLITINYETNLFGLNGPRRMQTYIPSANYLVRGGKNLQQVYQSEKEANVKNEPMKIQHFINKKPKWNSEISSFVLNFNGRATISSVKNFIIIRPSPQNKKQNHDNLVLFGKIEKNMFNLDIKYPFNLIQGLALALSSFDKKIACE